MKEPDLRDILKRIATYRPSSLLERGLLSHTPHLGDVFKTAQRPLDIPKDAPRIQDGTQELKRIIQKDIPKAGIQLEVLPLFGKQGYGKSACANTIAHWIIEKHGAKNVNIKISNDFRALQEHMDPTKDVQLLFLDDAIDSLFSRGGTPAELREAIAGFFKTRHAYERAKRKLAGEDVGDNLNATVDDLKERGLIFVILASQSYKATEKSFRQGITIFKSPLEEDKQEISMYWVSSTNLGNPYKQADAAWDVLFKVQRKKMLGDSSALSTSIVTIPSLGPMILHGPMIETNHFLGNRVVYEEKRPDAELQRRFEVHTHIAGLFISAGHDPAASAASSHLRDFLKSYCLKLASGTVEDAVLKAHDWIPLALDPKPSLTREILDRAKSLKIERTKHEAEARSEVQDDDGIIDLVATAWIDEGGRPLDKKVAAAKLYQFIRTRYRDQPLFRQRAHELEKEIMRVATTIYLDRYGAEEGVEDGPTWAPAPEAAAVPLAAQFEFPVRDWVERLPGMMAERAVKNGKDPRSERAKWERNVRAYKIRHDEGKNSDIQSLESRELYGETVTGRAIRLWIEAVELEIQNIMGAEYERWWKTMLDAGYRHNGLRDAPLVSVEVGGGSTHEPDVVVRYADGGVDYWSLKCYTAKESVTFTLANLGAKKKSNFAPELKAFTDALREHEETRQQGLQPLPARPRLCVAYREVTTSGAEFFRTYETLTQLQPTVNFNRSEIGTPAAIRWTPPASSPSQPDEAEGVAG